MTPPIGALAAAAATREAAAAPAPTPNDLISKQQFLVLFIEQLKHQDPLSPLQPDQLTAQLAQFSSLEQLTGINERLDALAASARQTTASALLGLIGRAVRVEGGHVEVRDGEASRVVYELGAAVERATATVRAADGSVVRVVELGGQAAGEHTFEFDGENAEGVAVPDGSYTVEVTAAAPGAPPEPVALTSVATVEGVDLSSDPPVVLVAGRRVPLDEILEVRAEERAASAAP